MITTDLLNQAWAKAEGEAFTDGVDSDNWNYMLILANYYIGTWTTEYGVNWLSLYDPLFKIGIVTATDTFNIDTDEVRKLSEETDDFVRIVHSDGSTYTDYKIVHATQLKQYFHDKACAKVGETIKFSRPFTSDDAQIGGTIYVPKYGVPDQLTGQKSTIPVDNPAWLVCMIAYDVSLHDILRKDISNNLLEEANEVMKSMKSDNNAAQELRINEFDMSNIGSNNVV